jgi:hypothetical protein
MAKAKCAPAPVCGLSTCSHTCSVCSCLLSWALLWGRNGVYLFSAVAAASVGTQHCVKFLCVALNWWRMVWQQTELRVQSEAHLRAAAPCTPCAPRDGPLGHQNSASRLQAFPATGLQQTHSLPLVIWDMLPTALISETPGSAFHLCTPCFIKIKAELLEARQDTH